MSDKYYTVDEIAEMIKIHPKTVQRYIREGRLKASKVGKSWRVSGHDLSTFTEGGSVSGTAPIMIGESFERGEIKVSAVVDIPVENTQESVRIASTLTAISNSKPAEYGASSLQTQYLMSEKVIRVMLWGSLAFTQIILDSINTLSEKYER
jgi:excisionase family DNA binding protein